MKIKRFNDINEGVRDQMTPKSQDEIFKALLNLTPYGMLDRIYRGEDLDMLEDTEEVEEMARERVEESIGELNTIIENYKDKNLPVLVSDVAQWVKKNGGNDVNVQMYGFDSLANQITNYGIQDRHDTIVIYDDDVFESFIELLKNFALSEVRHNNKDYNY
jgi:hypothetical protein